MTKMFIHFFIKNNNKKQVSTYCSYKVPDYAENSATK